MFNFFKQTRELWAILGVSLLVGFAVWATTTPEVVPEAVAPAPIPEPFSGEVTVRYHYDYDIPSEWMKEVPEAQVMKVQYEGGKWSRMDFDIMVWGPTLFSFEVQPPDDRYVFGGCRWEYTGSEYDDDTLYWAGRRFEHCNSVAQNTEIPVDVTLAYCRRVEGLGLNLLCTKQGLTVFVTKDYITFAASDTFLPQYREWIREVMDYEGFEISSLPKTLMPDYSYTIDRQSD